MMFVDVWKDDSKSMNELFTQKKSEDVPSEH